MLELFKPIYDFLFRNSYGWLGKLAASTLIGWLSLSGAAFLEGEPEIAKHWSTFGALGGCLGFMAALILISRDIGSGFDVDDPTRTPTRLPPAFGSVLMAFAVVGMLVSIIVGILIFGPMVAKH